ncbi:MAG: hypothetical protein J5842_03100, partial [Lachnospiraceae bacterium]|nr:hypothetical protein [Lachnospiraceae bacterium]
MSNVQLGYMQMPSGFRYRNVFMKGYPRHEGWDSFRIKHPPMPASRWAKIFAPFDALKGFDEAIGSKEELYVDRIEMSDEQHRSINKKLRILKGYTFNGRMAKANRIMVSVEYFEPCTDQDNMAFDLQQGKYENVNGMVLGVDDVKEIIRLK